MLECLFNYSFPVPAVPWMIICGGGVVCFLAMLWYNVERFVLGWLKSRESNVMAVEMGRVNHCSL